VAQCESSHYESFIPSSGCHFQSRVEMMRAAWTQVAQSERLQRSSHNVSVIGKTAYIFGGELKPRQPRDNDVFQVSVAARLGIAGMAVSLPFSSSILHGYDMLQVPLLVKLHIVRHGYCTPSFLQSLSLICCCSLLLNLFLVAGY